MGAEEIVELAIELPGSIVRNGIIIMPFFWAGLSLIATRWLFMEFCPWGARHAKLTTAFVNMFMEICWAIFEAIKLCIDVVIEIINAIPGVHGGHLLKVDDPPKPLSAEEVREFLNTVPKECHEYVWGNSELLQFPLRKILNPVVCPLIRYFYPVDWAFNGANNALGWLSEDATPVAGGNNCQGSPDIHWLCVGFGTGYLILEILVPLMIFILIAMPLVFALVGEFFTLARRTIKLGFDIEKFVFKIINRLGELVEDFIAVN